MDDVTCTHPVYVAVIGAGEAGPDLVALAEEVGRLVAEAGAILVCGGLGGVMEAAARGARSAGGTTLGILPGHERRAANPYLDIVVTTGTGHARNLAVVSSGDAVIAVGGAWGTLSEIGLAATLGRPVVLLHSWQLRRALDTKPGEAKSGRAGEGSATWSPPPGAQVASTAQQAMDLIASVLHPDTSGRRPAT
jgi:uncharacterized protein (TIGR00725 family)